MTTELTPALALRPRDAARMLGISERLLWALAQRGDIPPVRIGRAVRYRVADLERFLAERAGKGADDGR